MSVNTSKVFPEAGAFAVQADHISGLIFRCRGGQILNASGVRQGVLNASVTLTASSTNYVEVSAGGTVSANTTGYTSGSAPLYKVTTSATEITNIEDARSSPRSAAVHAIPISSLRHTTGVPLTAAETAGGFNVSLASHVHKAQAEVTDNETEVSVTHALFPLPANYIAGGAITVRLRVAIIATAAAVNNGSTIDLVAYKQADGAVGSDLCETAAQTFAALDTWYSKDFVITPTGLVAGDLLQLEITSSIVDSEAGAGTLRLNMETPKVLLDVAA